MHLSAWRVGALLGVSVLVSACGEQQQQAAVPVARPVKTMVVPAPEGSSVRTLPARIESQRRAEVSFRVPGTIIDLPVKEGDFVQKDQVLARLDPTDYRLVVKEREATSFRANRDYERAKPLAEKGHVTKRELDRREADMKTARAALDRAKQDLSYTTLKAPFTGRIAKRLVQKFEEVRAKQTILELRDLRALEVKFDVPELIMLRLTRNVEARGKTKPAPQIYASFDAVPGKKFDLQFKEIATSADEATRTFEATYTMQTPQSLTVLPGMTANVTIDLTGLIASNEVIYIPVEAVTATNELGGKVWVVDEQTMTLSARRVKIGPLKGRQIAITDGLKPGERIVVAGVPFLFAGMKVHLLPALEQAQERGDDVRIRRRAEQRIQETRTQQQRAQQH